MYVDYKAITILKAHSIFSKINRSTYIDRSSYIDEISIDIGRYFIDWKTLYKRLEIIEVWSKKFEALIDTYVNDRSNYVKKKRAKEIKALVDKYTKKLEETK